MFDIGFSELLVVAVVALVVIGPERLPTVARTVGALLGRLNRYVSDVKSDVEREMRLEEMKKLRAEVEQQAMSIEQSVVNELETTRSAVAQPAAEVEQSLADVMRETGQTGVAIQSADAPAAAAPPDLPHGDSLRSQNNSANATSIAAPDPFNDPAPMIPAASSATLNEPATKA